MARRKILAPLVRRQRQQDAKHNSRNEAESSSAVNCVQVSSHITKSKLYLVGVPRPGRHINSILLDTTAKPAEVVFVTTEKQLTGTIIIDNAKLWSTNCSRLLSVLEPSLYCLSDHRNTAQMRVTFGSFVFEQYRQPKDTQNGYSFDEFEDMISQSVTRGHIVQRLSINDLLNHIGQSKELFALDDEQSPSYTMHRSVKIEFMPIGQSAVHLEVDLEARNDSDTFERVCSRWVETDINRPATDTRPHFQAVMLNAERADWELCIKEKTILNPNKLHPSMRELQAKFRFGHPISNPLVGPPQQWSRIPDDSKVCRLMEKSTMRYSIRHTEYVLELARFDVYLPEARRKRASDPISPLKFRHSTSFTEVVLYNPSWNDRLEAISKKQTESILESLFKPREMESVKDAFDRFIMTITNVANLWHSTDAREVESIPRSLPMSEGVLIDLD